MQRYPATSLGGGVSNNNTVGPSSRESSRVDSSFSATNYPLNSRRPSPLVPYKIKCDKEPFNSRFGPPDFYPQTPNCPEEILTKEYLQSGYKETVEGIEEAKEVVLTGANYFVKSEIILKCKEAVRKRLRLINDLRAQKRKAGQVYGVPLSGPLLVKHGVFPEQKPCVEDFRRKWIEALSQQNKRLRSLADHVPHGYRRKSLFEVLIRYNVPLLRATWFIKINYLNQARPSSTDKAQTARTEMWTKDVIEYLTQLLDEIIVKDGQSTSALLTQQRLDAASAVHDAEEPSLLFKWQYMVQLLNWHYAEGLLLPSLIIEWALNQLQEKESAEAFELLLPVVSEIIESLSLSQTFVRTFVDTAIRFIHDNCPDCSTEDPNVTFLTSTLIEMVNHLMLTVPDSFVALDCFQLIPCLFPDLDCKNTSQMKLEEINNNSADKHLQHKSLKFMFSSIYKRASELGKIVNPSIQGHGAAKVIKYLDKALLTGDLRSAYISLFEDLSDEGMEEKWIAEVSPFLRSSLKWFGSVSLSLVCSVFFLCEWATCEYRDHRSALPQNLKFSGGKDIAQVYMSVLLLKLKREDLRHSLDFRNTRNASETSICLHDGIFSQTELESSLDDKKNKADIFRSPGPLHDIIVCWLDQHETGEGFGSFKRVQFLLMELIRNGIFYPQAYLRQLIVSGIMDRNEASFDLVRRARHYRILNKLPGSCMFDILKEAQIAEFGIVREASRVYSNERRFVLQGRSLGNSTISKNIVGSALQKPKDKDGNSSAAIMSNSSVIPSTSNQSRAKKQLLELKGLISSMLHLPYSCETVSGEFSASLKKNRVDILESTPVCNKFKRAKRQKIGDERSPSYQAVSSNLLDDDSWFVRKGIKTHDSIKVEPPQKLTKNASRNRQKAVRKTSSLAQLAAARVESSQGASTSHVCDNNINCSHHRSNDIEIGISNDVNDQASFNDIGKSLKQLRLLEKRSISIWLLTSIKQLIERNDKSSGAFSVPFKDKIAGQWKLGEYELSIILHILDCCDLVSAVRLILWLLPKIAWRNAILPKNRVVQSLQVGEAFLLSAIQRYEDIVVATDLLSETLSALVHRNVSLAQSNEKTIISASFIYAQKLLKEYKDVPSVVKWEKKFRPTCDQRLLAELDSRRAVDGELGIAGSDDIDEYRQKMSGGRVPRTGLIMKDLIKRHVEDSVHYFSGKERKVQVPLAQKSPPEKITDPYHVAQDIVQGLADCIRQNREADGDLSVVASAVFAIVNSIGPAVINVLDASTPGSNTCVQHILRIHINSLCLLKDFLGESFSRIIDLALAAEASSAVSVAFASGKTHRSSFQPSLESNDTYMNHSENTKIFAGKAAKAAAAVSALVIGSIVHGVISLERMIKFLKLKEGLDVIQFIRSRRTSSNGTSRNSFKIESVEVYVHWFRLLVGNCRTIFDGLVTEIVGELYITSLSRMQRRLPLSMVFSPAYSIFSMVIWRPYIFSNNMVTREDILLYHSLCSAIGDIIKHHPFRDSCLQDTHAFYDHLSRDASDSEFAAMLELHGPDKHLKTMAFVPLRSRMFLNAIIDCKMPPYTLPQEDGSFAAVPIQIRENDGKLQDKIVHIFDNIQPAKFHWQWVELRLLLNEQALVEKIETKESFVEAIRSLSPNAENFAISESEKFLSQIVLTRILVRPDAASLYAEIAHLLGKSLEESLVMDIKWILAGGDVLSGRKLIKQQLMSVAQRNNLSTKAQFWKPWGWSNSNPEISFKPDRKKFVHVSIEEGEVIDEPVNTKKCNKKSPSSTSHDSDTLSHQYVTEKALADLIFPCLDRCSTDLRNSLTAELIKQMSTIDLQINVLARVSNKQSSASASGNEASIGKSNSRKGSRGGSPGMGRRQIAAVDLSPPSVAALRSSMWLRLHFLVRLLPIVYADREPSPRNMRHTLASIILRLLGTRFIYDDAEFSHSTKAEYNTENSTAASSENYQDSLFDMLLSVLHALLSSWKPNWLKSNSSSKSNIKSLKDFSAFDREVLESLQSELDRMDLPSTIRRRIQSAMPILPSPPSSIFSCHPPSLPSNAFSTPASSTQNSNIIPRLPPSSRAPPTNSSSKSKAAASTDSDMEIDPWTLLEEGTVPAAAAASNNNTNTSSSSSSGDHSHLKACSWLKGAVRVRRTDLTYVGALDDNS